MVIFYWIYTILAVCAFIIALPYMFFKMAMTGKYRDALSQMLGFWPQEIRESMRGGCIWIHAVSVGEAVAASGIVQELKKLNPEKKILISTVTESGQKMARRIINDADGFIYFPLDFPWLVKKALRLFRPKIFVMVETELWPNFLRESRKFGTINVMVNGRISEKSLKQYRKLDLFGRMFQDMLSKVELFSMQSEIDAQNILSLGAEKKKVLLTGNTKFDQSYGHLTPTEKEALLKIFGLSEAQPVLVVGSTHKGEEEYIFNTFLAVKEKYPDYKMILAPRHLDRINEVENLAHSYNLKTVRRTALPASHAADIILLDTIGELGQVYGLAEIVYVGGSLVNTGGHNLLEPAAQGKPMLFGPYMSNFKETVALVLAHEAGKQVQDKDELTRVMLELLADPAQIYAMGQNAEEMVRENKGASLRNARIIVSLLPKWAKERKKKSHLEQHFLEMLLNNPSGWRDKSILALLAVCSFIYQHLLTLALFLHKIGVYQTKSLPCFVISVGNITVGGTGKTPTTQMLASFLQRQGLRVVVLNRGYRSTIKDKIAVVSDGKQVYLSSQEAGDEAYMLAQSLPGVPVMIGVDRAASGQYAVDNLGAQVLILDDGYQFWKLKRDLNIVLIDVSNPFSNGYVLPRGLLREPLKHLDRADLFLLSKSDYSTREEKDKVKAVLRRLNDKAPILETDYAPSYLKEYHSGRVIRDFTLLQDKKVLALSGLSNPGYFEKMIGSCRISELAVLRYPDHHNYSLEDMEEIAVVFKEKGLDLIITTEKDAVSIPPEWQEKLPLWVLGIEVKPEKIIEERKIKEMIMSTLQEKRREKNG